MNADQIAAFFLFSLVAAITPGPSNVLLTATGAQVGFWRGLPCVLGVAAGMGSLMFLAAFGLGSAVLSQPQFLLAVRIIGAAFLLWLAWKIATAGQGQEDRTAEQSAAPPPGKPAGFVSAAMLQWVNPKAWMVSAGAVATYLQASAAGAMWQSLGFAAVFVAAALPSSLVWLIFGTAAQRLLRNRRRQRAFNIAMGLALAGSVLMILA